MANPYELWSTRTSLGIMRDQKMEGWYFGQFFQNTLLSTEEWVDFEKLPILKRRLAPFVLPLGRGYSVWDDSQRSYRFKPAYSIVEDHIDPLAPLSFTPGMNISVFEQANKDPMLKLALLRTMKLQAADMSVERRWEWMCARAIIDGGYTVSGPGYPTTPVAFGRDASQTVVLASGARWGDSGVSIVSMIQSWLDTMNNAEFGGLPSRITMGSAVAAVVRQDAEFLKHMDVNITGGTIRVDRGLVTGGPNGGKIYKFGEMQLGGASGATIELWVNDETYDADNGDGTVTKTRYLGANQVVLTADPSVIMGYKAFGRIVDRDAEYQALPKFPKFFFTGDDVKTENFSIKSAPLMVPINPNATFKATVLA